MIRISSLTKQIADRYLYRNLNLEFQNEKISVLFAPNGTGKSSLLKILAGADTEYEGSITGVANRRIGFVFQDYRKSLFPWLSVEENLFYPLKVQGISREVFCRRLEFLSEVSGFRVNLNAKVFKLSGGEAQMVAILRALINEPEVLYLDEPFSALDYGTSLTLRKVLRDLALTLKLTVIMISHDLDEAIFCADEIFFMSNRISEVKKIPVGLDKVRGNSVLTSSAFAYIKQACLKIIEAKSVCICAKPNELATSG